MMNREQALHAAERIYDRLQQRKNRHPITSLQELREFMVGTIADELATATVAQAATAQEAPPDDHG